MAFKRSGVRLPSAPPGIARPGGNPPRASFLLRSTFASGRRPQSPSFSRSSKAGDSSETASPRPGWSCRRVRPGPVHRPTAGRPSASSSRSGRDRGELPECALPARGSEPRNQIPGGRLRAVRGPRANVSGCVRERPVSGESSLDEASPEMGCQLHIRSNIRY